jgi:hypothetical protein
MSAPRPRLGKQLDATRFVRTLLERNVVTTTRGQRVDKAGRSWTRERALGRILWIKKLTGP